MRFLKGLTFGLLVLLPALAAAQQQGTITGVVRDASGAVLPGVTVEVASPALIEKVRTVITDGSGQYQVVDLRPGVYSVTFTLAGFNTTRREGIELSGSFTATVSIDMRVGSLEETITVTGESPIVDVQNTRGQRVISEEVVNTVPSPRSAIYLAALIPGVTAARGGAAAADVGGTLGDNMARLQVHGSKEAEFRINLDGVPATNSSGNGADTSFEPNLSGTQEIVIDTSAASAEAGSGAPRINMIPREGGNTFKGTLFVTAANSAFQSSNFSDDLKARGLLEPNSLKELWDINPGFGGPISRDKVWFYLSFRSNAANNYTGGNLPYTNLNRGNANVWTYAPNTAERQYLDQEYRVAALRLTWQVNGKNKIALTVDQQGRRQCGTTETGRCFKVPLNNTAGVTWTAPMTNKLLLEAALGYRVERWRHSKPTDQLWNLIGVTDQGLGISYRARTSNIGHADVLYPLFAPRASVSYVTGTHVLKVGYNQLRDWEDRYIGGPGVAQLSYRFNNGVPNQLTQFAYPIQYQWQANQFGLFAQDKWTAGRMTINAGVRFDYFHNYFPETHVGPSLWTPDRNVTFPREDFSTFKDVTPRFGIAYDLFGTGKTALKASVNKYVAQFIGQGAYGNRNPATLMSSQVTRSWTDSNGNFVADCNLFSPLAQNLTASGGDNCGAISDVNFGKTTRSTAIDPAILTKRPYNWEFSAGVQHELFPRVSVDIGYFRRIYGGFTVTENRAVTAADYTAFSIVAPANAALPNGGGYTISGLMDLNPDKFGQVDQVLTLSDNFGKQIEHWNGMDFSVNARLPQGILAQGGISTGRTVTDNCAVLKKVPEVSPLGVPYCAQNTGFLTQVKALAAYTVPRANVQVAATLMSTPGPSLSANFVAANALVQPSLGRPLSGGSNVTVDLLNPYQLQGERLNQLDLRFAKPLTFNGTRLAVNFDIYNAANASTVVSENSNYAQWRQPTAILSARLFKFSLQFDF